MADQSDFVDTPAKDRTRLWALLLICGGSLLTLLFSVFMIVGKPDMSSNGQIAVIMVIQAMISILTGIAGFYFGGEFKPAPTVQSQPRLPVGQKEKDPDKKQD